jgi:phosphate transport system protein
VELAMSLKPRDKELDAMQREFIARLTSRMEEDTAGIKDYMDLIFIARFLERSGDHAVNIGEDAVYAGAARDIRHVK